MPITRTRKPRRLTLQCLEDRAVPAVVLGAATQIGETGQEWAEDITLDGGGNRYITGHFLSPDADGVDFDPGPGVYNLQEHGEYGAFVAKYAPDGGLTWAWAADPNGATSTSGAWGQAVTSDPAGNVYVTGYFYGTVDFDPANTHPGDTDVLTWPTYSAMFLAKLNPDGTLAWATAPGGGSQGTDIAVDGAGNIYLTANDLGAAKYDPSGRLLWTAALPVQALALSGRTSASPAVYLTGGFVGRVDLDPGPGRYTVGAAQRYTSHVTKLTSDGAFVWADAFVGDTYGFNNGAAVAVDGAGNVVATGQFGSRTDFDPGKGSYFLSPNSTQTAFVVKLTGSGQWLWAKNLAGHPDDLALDSAGNIYLTGYFGDANMPFDFDPGPGTYLMTPTTLSGYQDAYVAKLDANGNFAWAVQLAAARGKGVAVDAAGHVYATGFFSLTADFDPTGGTYNLTSAGSQDVYLWRLDQV